MEGEAEEDGAGGGALAVTIAMAMAVQRDGYERVVAAQAAQIAELQATVAHERQTSQRWQEALQREQTLRALSAMTVSEEATPLHLAAEALEARGPDAASVRTDLDTPETRPSPEPPQNAPQAPKKTFWQRLLGG